MKTKLKTVIVILIAFCSLILSSCQKSTDLTPYLSQLRNKIFSGENDRFLATVFTEIRETPFIADGNRGELNNIVIIKLKPKFSLSSNATASFCIDKEYSASLALRPENDCFIATIIVNELPKNGLTLTISHKDKVENIELVETSLTAPYSIKDALKEIATTKKQLIDNYLESLTPFEVQARIIINDDKLFYFIGIVDSEKTNCFLINSKTLEIVAEKTIKNNSKK